MLLSSLRPRPPEPREARWREIMALVAEESTQAYRAFVQSPRFMDYFRSATPIDVIERMTLRLAALAPAGRQGCGARATCVRSVGIRLDQARAVIPGWYGVGTGLQAAVDAHGEDALREMARDWPFLKTFLDDVSMVLLAKGDLSIAMYCRRWRASSAGRSSRRCSRTCGRGALGAGAQWQRLAAAARPAPRAVDPVAQSLHRSDQRDAGGPAEALARQRPQDDALLHALVASIDGMSQGVQNTG